MFFGRLESRLGLGEIAERAQGIGETRIAGKKPREERQSRDQFGPRLWEFQIFYLLYFLPADTPPSFTHLEPRNAQRFGAKFCFLRR